VQKRLLAHLAGGAGTDFAAAPLAVPAHVYTDPARLEAERRELFLKLPLLAGLSCDIPNPGDIKLFDGAGPSIIITRNSEGAVNAFRNMCTHRGTKLVTASCHVRKIVCPFHGWCFDNNGVLTGLPGKAGFEGIDKQSLNLLRVPVAERYGMIFVKTEVGDEEIDVDEFLGDLAPVLQRFDFTSMALVKRGNLFAAGNWKHVLDTYGEGYHFVMLHPDTLGSTHYTNVMAYDEFGPHWRVSYAAKSLGQLTALPESEWPALDPMVFYIFPNTALVVGSPQPGLEVIEIFNIFPGDVRSTHVDLALYAPANIVTEATRPMLEAGYDLAARIVELEDYSISAGACENLRWAPPDFNIVLGRNEIALQSTERRLAEAAGMPID
jgi:phenylpropionate dioxygenase-like ring-hydroxylating dioxygenase large terminal subunit